MFRFPIPTGTAPYLKKRNVFTEDELIQFIERQLEQHRPRDFGQMLWQDIKLKKIFIFYQRHKTNNEFPFLSQIPPSRLANFLFAGVLNEALLKEYSLRFCIQTLIEREHIKYLFFRDIIKDEEHALDHFYDHFSERTNLILKQNMIQDADDLKNFIEIKKMKARGLGNKGKAEVMSVWETHFSTRT
jgi:hypothetical protein